jgi:ankyrin repeat protein
MPSSHRSQPESAIPSGRGWILAAVLGFALAGCADGVDHTPLGAAAASGDLEAVRALLEHAGADPNAIAEAGWAPLHLASRHADLGILHALIAGSADLELRDERNGWTPLLHAIHVRNVPAVTALVEAGADLNRAGRSGITPLIMASGYGMADTVRLLLAGGADPHAEMSGLNALWAAAGGGAINDFTDGPPLGRCSPEVIEILRDHAPDLRMGSGFRSRALGWLANDECEPLVAALVAESDRAD